MTCMKLKSNYLTNILNFIVQYTYLLKPAFHCDATGFGNFYLLVFFCKHIHLLKKKNFLN